MNPPQPNKISVSVRVGLWLTSPMQIFFDNLAIFKGQK